MADDPVATAACDAVVVIPNPLNQPPARGTCHRPEGHRDDHETGGPAGAFRWPNHRIERT